MKKFQFISVFVLFSMQLFAQKQQIIDSINFYGMLRVHIASFDKQWQLQENSPRFGLFINRKINDQLSVNAKLEYGIHLINGVSFNNDANSSAEFMMNPFKRAEVFTNRLAFVSLTHKTLGSLTIGKQWGVYYDIGFYTDNFSLFGGSANGIYVGGTDGGWKGTGRADNAIQYRNKIGKFELGLQTQLFGDYLSYGLSAQLYVNNAFTIGASYNSSEVPDNIKSYIYDIGNKSDNFIAGVKYNKAKWYGAATFSINDDAINVASPDSVISYDTYGYELSVGYKLNSRFSLEGGFNYMQPQNTAFNQNNYKLAHYILGLNYFITPLTRVYIVSRISNSKLAFGKNEYSVLALGFRYNFEYGKSFVGK